MSGPRIPFRRYSSLAESIDVTTLVGIGGLSLLVPADEPLSAGPIPIRPTLVTSVARPHPLRSVRCGTFHPITMPLSTKPRPVHSLRWVGISTAERDTLLAFFRDELEGIRFGFDLEVDGRDVPSSMKTLRFLIDPTVTWKAKSVHELPDLAAEELFG